MSRFKEIPKTEDFITFLCLRGRYIYYMDDVIEERFDKESIKAVLILVAESMGKARELAQGRGLVQTDLVELFFTSLLIVFGIIN